MPDARGHGDSTRMAVGAAPDPAGDLAAVIAGVANGPVDLLGHSVGARAAAGCAAAHPRLVRRLVLVDPPLMAVPDASVIETRRAAWREQVARFQTMSLAKLHEVWRRAHPDWDESEFPAWAEAKRKVDAAALPRLDRPWQEPIEAITVPTLLVCGAIERGSLVSAAAAEEAQAINPLIRCVRIAEGGHNIHREAFAAFVSLVAEFLSADMRDQAV